MSVDNDEAEFMYYKNGTAGSFKTGLYDLYFKADEVNRARLMQVFPYLWVAEKYSKESGYYEDLRLRWINSR
jgi:hypothetical protein